MNKLFSRLKPYLIFVFVFLVWWGITATGLTHSYFLPSPLSVGSAFLDMIKSGELFSSIFMSIVRVFLGWLIAFIIAFICSIFAVFCKKGWEYFRLFGKFIRSIPPLSLFPFLILILGIGEGPKFFVIALTAFFPMFINFSSGLENANKDLVDLGRSLGFSKLRMLFKIYLPLAYQAILNGIQTSLSYSWRSLVGVEIISSYKGLGFIIQDALLMHNLSRMFVGIITLGILGVLFDSIFALVLKRCVKNYER